MRSVVSRAPLAICIPPIAAGENSHHQCDPDLAHVNTMAAERVTEREEIQRVFLGSGLTQADELPDGPFWIDDMDQAQFSRSFELRNGKPVPFVGIPFERPLQHLNLVRSSSSPVTRVSNCTSPHNSRHFPCT